MGAKQYTEDGTVESIRQRVGSGLPVARRDGEVDGGGRDGGRASARDGLMM